MKTRTIFLAMFMMCFTIAAVAQEATTQPSDQSDAPATRPEGSSSRQRNSRSSRRFDRRNAGESASMPTTPPVILDAVSARNIFLRGNQRPPPAPAPGSVQVPSNYVYTPSANQLVLTGVSLEDNEKVGFLEDQQAYKVTQVKVGDPIANGKVVNMTLDALDYKDPTGRTIRVEVGYNLAGGDVWGVSGSAGSTTQPASSAPRAPGESMEDYLRRRRASETAH